MYRRYCLSIPTLLVGALFTAQSVSVLYSIGMSERALKVSDEGLVKLATDMVTEIHLHYREAYNNESPQETIPRSLREQLAALPILMFGAGLSEKNKNSRGSLAAMCNKTIELEKKVIENKKYLLLVLNKTWYAFTECIRLPCCEIMN